MTSPNVGGSDWTGVTPQFKVGDVVAKRYRIEAFIRQDLFGSIYLVRHTRYGQALILKAFHPFHFSSDGDVETLRESFKSAKSISHVGAGRYLEVGEAEGVRYVTMERVEGKSLRQFLDEYLKSGLVLSLKDAKNFLLQIVDILNEVHNNIPHGNLNPDKVLLPARIKPGLMGESSDIKLLDFALLEINAAATGDLALAPATEVCYSPPELIQYGGAPSTSADVYGAAAIFYEMLTGQQPLPGYESPSIVRRDIPEEIDYFIEQALHETPSERLSMSTFLERLKNLPEEKSAEDYARPPTSKATLVLLTVLLGVGGLIVWNAVREPELDPVQVKNNEANLLRNEARKFWKTESDEAFTLNRKSVPVGMAYVPAGKFLLGRLPTEFEGISALEPDATIVDMPGFYIDIFDYPNKKNGLAEVDITWQEASNSCEKIEKRLCTTEEWERTCKGSQAFNYPYGDDFEFGVCAPSKKKDLKSGAFSKCLSGFQAADMAGGTWEWTSSASPENPDQRIVKGGYGTNDAAGSRCSFRNNMPATATYSYLSFRCCKDAPTLNEVVEPDQKAPKN